MSPSRAEPEAPLRADAARNRHRLLEVARERVRQDGRPPSMTVLARMAGVGIGTAYRHFPTPTSLLEALGSSGMQQLVDAARSAADDPDPVAGFERVVGGVLRGQLTDPGIAAILDAPDDGCTPPGPLAVQLGAAVHDLLTRARAAGAVREDVDADDIRRLLVGAAHALRPVAADERLVALHLQLLLDALHPPRRPATGTTTSAVPAAQPFTPARPA